MGMLTERCHTNGTRRQRAHEMRFRRLHAFNCSGSAVQRASPAGIQYS